MQQLVDTQLVGSIQNLFWVQGIRYWFLPSYILTISRVSLNLVLSTHLHLGLIVQVF